MSDEPKKPTVYSVCITTKPVGKLYPNGQVAYGFYTVADDVVTMTDPDGVPADDGTEKKYSRKLGLNEDPRALAGRMTKELRNALRGSTPPGSGPKSPIHYPNKTWKKV